MATPIPPNRARFTLDELAAVTRGTLRHRARADAIIGATSDSRAVTTGAAFVALRGERHDAHEFVESAARRGAGVVVVERGRLAVGVETTEKMHLASIVEVDDTLEAWGALAGAHLAHWRAKAIDPRVVAITGSAGKTTTKELTAALLRAIAPTHFTAGNLNNRIGVPSVVLALTEVHRFCVLEMGMSLPGELDAITAFARPDVSLVTNVGVAHSEGVGGRDGVMREKGAVYRALASDGVAIVNADDPYARRASLGTRAGRIVTFGRAEDVDYRLASREPLGADGSVVTLVVPGGRTLALRLPLPGEAAAIDLAAALAAAEAASGVALEATAIDAALAGVALEGRGTIRRLERDIVLLDDTYNANPQSMRVALATLSEIAGPRRKVAVLGEMKELGVLADAEHASLGDAIAEAGIGLAIGCGGRIDLALEAAAKRGVEAVRASSTDDAAREATARIRAGDAVLVKASRSVGAEKVVESLLNAAKSAVLGAE